MPIVVYLSCRINRKLPARESIDQVEAHVNSRGDSSGHDDGACIHPAAPLQDRKSWKHCAHVGDIFPVGRRRSTCKQTRLCEQK